MASTTSVNKALTNIADELDYVKDGIKNGESREDLSKWVDDVQAAINSAVEEFNEYSDEVEDIEYDFDGLVKRLSEVYK
ncbi:hypothetical protein NE172_18290 [Clostridium botulinum]|uniref:Uncharacterized protein n=1 Tax=Clostridium botulinum TaxID=1491 RepID=A0A6B4JRI3_CLOBO|nr:hypothetical protein [Clostridium botulinum]EES50206.1 hypothetical protein CLO_1540 [Clostridium botulinum E1 str. 'BoNT E Beluga']MBY6762867.1 hypothetical protein [Clostridium botulinum]MBY6921651.1 hypothetical protein [Clostridium botulinum]MCR1132853.1 hypothetical protein [Clostridium botulinum]NFH70797.1 hypothetical protein [Clostridium botulinum]